MIAIRRLLPDRFLMLLLATLALGTLVPAQGDALAAIGWASNAAIFVLFILHGARLERSAVVRGAGHWRLHGAVLAFGYGVMPLAGLGMAAVLAERLSPALATGILFLCILPTTVQSSIAYASIARGNLAASVIAAAVSNLLAVAVVPLWLLASGIAGPSGGGGGAEAAGKIALLLLLPFAIGQASGRRLRPVIQRHQRTAGSMDRLTIVLAVYVAFSQAANEGLWSRVAPGQLALVAAVVALMLAAAFAAAWALGGLLGLSPEDRVTLLFSGAHKSLATGAPMARILLPGAVAGAAILPLMLYHQLQLMASAVIAARLARRD